MDYMSTKSNRVAEDFSRDFYGLLMTIDIIQRSSAKGQIYAYVTESMRSSNYLWSNIKIKYEYDKLIRKMTIRDKGILSTAILDDFNHTIRLPNGNQMMIFHESLDFLTTCKAVHFSGIHHAKDIRVVT